MPRARPVLEPPEEEVDLPKLGENVAKIQKALASLEAGGLNRRGIITLIHEDTKIARRDIDRVLLSLGGLRTLFFHQPRKRRPSGRSQR